MKTSNRMRFDQIAVPNTDDVGATFAREERLLPETDARSLNHKTIPFRGPGDIGPMHEVNSHDRGCAPRVMAYCHDSVGIGHLRRTLAICGRVAAMSPDACFLLATGTPYLHLFEDAPRLDSIKLPALAKAGDGTYHSKYLNMSSEGLLRCRQAMLLQAAQHFAPHVLLVDKAPLGVCRELLPTLRWVRANLPATRIIFGMRDVEDDATATIRQWDRDGVPKALESCYDEIWVYGSREVYDVVAEYNLTRAIERKLRFMGFICREPCLHPRGPIDSQHEVLVTVGGGTDGGRVLRTYLAQAAGRAAARGIASTIVGGPDLPPEQAATLRQAASRIPGVSWIDVASCMSCCMKRADLVVCMGGYNTMCELLGHRKPMLIIPREQPRREQAIRADLWQQRGLAQVLPMAQLEPRLLGNRVMRMLAGRMTPSEAVLDTGGLDHVAERFAEFARAEAGYATAVRV